MHAHNPLIDISVLHEWTAGRKGCAHVFILTAFLGKVCEKCYKPS